MVETDFLIRQRQVVKSTKWVTMMSCAEGKSLADRANSKGLELSIMVYLTAFYLFLNRRGAPTNYHPGNEFFRDLVKEYQNTYLTSKRADKPFVASHIVEIIQSRGGRFLRRHKRNGVSWERGHFVWVEVDPQKAYEKACQALREGAPDIRRKLAESGSDADEDDATTMEASSCKPEREISHNTTSKKEQPGELLQKRVNESKVDGQAVADGCKKPAARE
jgi:hypothetical protein